MQTRIKKHASRVEEAIDLAGRVVAKVNYDNQKEHILEKYHFNTFDITQMMDDRSRIVRLFQKEFHDRQEHLEFFFARRSQAFSLSSLFVELPFFRSEKRRCRAVFDEDENRVSAFVQVFCQLQLIEDGKASDFEGLSLLLEHMDIQDEDKWLLQTVYLHLDTYLKRFCGLVNQIVDWLMNFEEQICLEEAAFYAYWSDFMSQNNLAKHLAEKVNIDVNEKTSQVWIVPSYFACNRIDYRYVDHVLYVYIGMIFDKSFSVEAKYETPALLCTHLKLLSDPSKFEILKTIKDRPYYGSELAKRFHLSTPTISHHMATLTNAGFIKTEKKENKTFYSLDRERLSLFLTQIHHMLLEKEV